MDLGSQGEATMDCVEDQDINNCDGDDYEKGLDWYVINPGNVVLAQI